MRIGLAQAIIAAPAAAVTEEPLGATKPPKVAPRASTQLPAQPLDNRALVVGVSLDDFLRFVLARA
jgi:hypothetical protein